MHINFKLLLLTIVPLLALIYISSVKFYESYDFQKNLNSATVLVELSKTVGSAIHELQQERGMSVGYISSNGEKFLEKLQNQKDDTDLELMLLRKQIGTLKFSQYDNSLKTTVNKVLEILSKLKEMRGKVLDINVDVDDTLEYYSSINTELINIVYMVSNFIKDSKISKQLLAYNIFLKIKENAGIERAVLSAVFSDNVFELKMFAKFITLIAKQDAYSEDFMNIATDNIKEQYLQKINSLEFQEIENMRKIAIENANIGDFNIDSEDWFSEVTKKIDTLKLIENAIISESKNEIESSSSSSLYIAIIMGIIVLLTLIVFIVTIASSPEFKFQYDYFKSKIRRRFRNSM